MDVILKAWDATNEVYRKLVCNDEGKLIIDPTEIFEDNPTENEHGKAPTSDWGYEHENDASAHHAKYTDAEAVSAVSTADDYLKNDGDSGTGDYDFDSGTLHVDSTNNRVGVNDSTPSFDLDVTGQVHASRGQAVSGSYLADTTTWDEIFHVLEDVIPNNGDTVLLHGGVNYSAVTIIFVKAERIDSDTIRIWRLRSDGDSDYFDYSDGGSGSYNHINIAW